MDTAIDKALLVLEALETGRGSSSLAAIAAGTGLPKPTVHRILAILERRGFVQQLASREYSFGPKIIALGGFAGSKDPMLTVARPVLDRLVVACGETVHLGVLHESQLLYLERREPEDAAVRLATLPSPLGALHASACGKVLLAFGDEALLRTVLATELVRYTPHTIADPDDLREELHRIAEQGYALSEQERNEGVRAVAVPVRNRAGTVVAGLSAAGPVQRMSDEKVAELRVQLGRAAGELAVGVR
ncbi:MAG TPA: IclR family transcriptional regulator [Mycobacteriales bacterium]|jgi:DNA-binding IclR family transcriptional regulator